MVLINVTTPPRRYSYEARILGFLIFEDGQNPIAFTTQEAYAKAIVTCLNSWYAILCHMPIKLGHSDARN